MPALLSLVTSVKDYIEIAHKLVETQGANYLLGSNSGSSGLASFLGIRDYTEFGTVLTYVVLSIKEFLINFLSFGWLNNIWSLPLIVPDVASAMISEISVLDSYFTNAFSFLENGLSTTLQSNANTIGMATDNLVALQKVNQNPFLFGFEKFIIGLLNSFFLFLPTSTAHLITLRRFVMQGIEAGFLAGLGTIAGNFVWLASIILGLRFIVIPWLSLDIFRYVLGFLLLVKYLWDSSKELNKTTGKANLDNNGKIQIVLLNFLLALTEQTSIYPFISNMSFGTEGSIIEGFSGTIFGGAESDNLFQFLGIHFCYLFGILLGSFSLLQFTVWFWENPAFSIYMWMISSYRVTTSSYYKILNFVFLYLTMLCAISSIPYFGLDYTITNPLGFIPQDRMITQKSDPATGGGDPILQETAFLGVKPTDKNSRIKEGVHARRERWKERLIKYQAFDASVYDQGVYDILTVEDLNYGFDRFWLRRKMRNHQIRFRLFPGPWMRSLKKQLNKPGFTGPRMEFFRILFEQYYHPSFHALGSSRGASKNKTQPSLSSNSTSILASPSVLVSNQNTLKGQTENIDWPLRGPLTKTSSAQPVTFTGRVAAHKQKGLVTEYSALRKFARNVNTRVNSSLANVSTATLLPDSQTKTIIYSKALKSLFTKINKELPKENLKTFRNLSKNLLINSREAGTNNPKNLQLDYTNWNPSNQGKLPVWRNSTNLKTSNVNSSFKELSIRKKLSKKERLLLLQKSQINQTNSNILSANVAVQPLNYYFQKNEAFKRKLKYYSTITTRKFSVGNNAPYFKSLLKRSFFYYKPSLRLKRTLFTAALRRGFRKKSVMPKKLLYTTNALTAGMPQAYLNSNLTMVENGGPKPTLSTSQYSVLGKRASRYRYQIYKDVLQHWYYTPFNRLLLKFDVDSFMNRQPKAQFLTKNEERLLHLRRVLLAEHYNTLRWYTYMQHYRTMKSKIGGVKSFANSVYNQQFQGTFKKIRHLFAITPSQATTSANLSILQFDQPLYNESNQTKNLMSLNTLNTESPPGSMESQSKGLKTSKSSFEIQSPYKHEDLTKKESTKVMTPLEKNTNSYHTLNAKPSKDFIDNSLGVTAAYVLQGQQTNYQKKNLESSNSNAKTYLIKAYVAQKNYAAITALLANKETSQNPENSINKLTQTGINTSGLQSTQTSVDTQIILLDLLKQAKIRLNDQTFLKNYISHRIEKRDQRAKATSKEVASKLVSLKNWLSPTANMNFEVTLGSRGDKLIDQGRQKLSTGSRKALSDGINVLTQKTNMLQQTELTKSLVNKAREAGQLDSNKQITNTLISLKELNVTLNQLKTNNKLNSNIKSVMRQNITISQNILNTMLKPFVIAQNSILAKRNEKNLEWWRQKQRVLTKRKASRKKSRAKNIKQVYQKNQPNANNQNNLQQQAFINWQDTNNAILNSSLNIPSWRNNSNIDSNSMNLRQKQEEISDNLLGRAHKTFNKYFLLKFRKKASSKGRRYRNMSMSRGFAYVRKPKNVNSFTTIPEYLDNIESIVGSNTINSVNKMYSTDILDKKLLSKEDKLNFLKDFKTKLTKQVITVERQNNGTTNTNSTESLTKLKNLLIQGQIKKSVNKKRSKRTWKKRKRQKFTKNHYKYRKRQIHGLGKLRVLAKKAKRIQVTQEFQHWWWNKYLPTIAEKANKINIQDGPTARLKPKADVTFKPLSTTKALEIRANLGTYANPYSEQKAQSLTQGLDKYNSYNNFNKVENLETPKLESTVNSNKGDYSNQNTNLTGSTNLLDQIYTNFMDADVKAPSAREISLTNSQNSLRSYMGRVAPHKDLKYNVTTTIPFYAGWDESLRKFVVTNRLLSRRDTGFEANISAIFNQNSNQQGQTTTLNPSASLMGGAEQQFTQSPVKGLNEASYLYLQTEMPFNSYIIDQFVPNNQSFYAPLGWSRFQFRHSLLNTWVNNTKMASSSNPNSLSGLGAGGSASKTNYSFFINSVDTSNLGGASFSSKNIKNSLRLENRRIKKRYALLKQSQMNLAYVPTGSLLAETLPAHFISVFDKQYRMPRTRYIKRNLPKIGLDARTSNSTVKDLTILDYSRVMVGGAMSPQNKNQEPPSFTLRKRIKPKRKYHKKRFTKKDGLIFPRRRKFGSFEIQNINSLSAPNSNQENLLDSNFRLRPSARMNVDDLSGTKTSSKALSAKSKKQSAGAGRKPAKTNPTRLRQLRRREFQQVFKPLQRFQPRYGGFTWPGDYLRLETIPMPKLENTLNLLENSTNSGKSTQSKLKRKINVQPIGLLPRKYLLQKHNLKVFKKKLALKYMGAA